MEHAELGPSGSRALIEKPPLALLLAADGSAAAADTKPVSTRQARIRAAAYARYESRGRTHGHDVDDWLAAEAEVDGVRTGGAGPGTEPLPAHR